MRIFLDDGDYRWFLYLLGKTLEDMNVACYDYCAMPNHVHVTVCPTQPNLSDTMRNLESAYAGWWNRKHGRVGHVSQGPFKDQIVQREGYLLALTRYIAMNPVRAQLVNHPAEWRWSSFSAIAGLVPAPSFLSVETIRRQFGEGDEALLTGRYVEHVLQQPPDDVIVDQIRSNERILGDRSFKALARGDIGLPQGMEVAEVVDSDQDGRPRLTIVASRPRTDVPPD
jgi:REP-associated tyrosine transposase